MSRSEPIRRRFERPRVVGGGGIDSHEALDDPGQIVDLEQAAVETLDAKHAATLIDRNRCDPGSLAACSGERAARAASAYQSLESLQSKQSH
jgi:hypothetical protein